MLKEQTLFIAPFKDKSGYARAARNYAKVLNSDNLILRSVRYDTGNGGILEQWLTDLHKKPVSSDVKTIIQMLTPNEMRPVSGKRNVAICCWETDKIPEHWVNSLNQFDVIIVPCISNQLAFIKSGVIKPIEVIPFVFFKEEYQAVQEKFQFPETDENTTIYYNISQWTHKKAIDSILISYFKAFQNNENVLLVLKGYINMQSISGDAIKLKAEVDRIKAAMRLPRYPKVYILDKHFSEYEIRKLHNSCHTYVNLSRGEGWGIPAYEALIMGNELISVNHTGMSAYLTPKANRYYNVESYLSPVFNMPHPDKDLYTSLENWYEPNVLSAAQAFNDSFNTLAKLNQNPTEFFSVTDAEVVKTKLLKAIN